MFCARHRLPENHKCVLMPLWWHGRGKRATVPPQQDNMKPYYATPLLKCGEAQVIELTH